jgi:hypothetical protein
MEAIKEKIQDSVQRVQEITGDLKQNITDGVSNTQSAITNTINQYTSPQNVGTTTTEYLYANTVVAKITFLLLVLILFIIFVSLGVSLLGYFLRPSGSPYLIKGILDGSEAHIIPQDPKLSNSVRILRSNNQDTGMEFTWSTWLNITDNNRTNNGVHKHIFNKGTSIYSSKDGIASVNNGPGLYLAALDPATNTNTLKIYMDVVDPASSPQVISITEIPFNKWVNVVIRLENTLLDVYINGVITSRLNLPSTAKQNYDDVNICQNGGFIGKISNLRYYNYALSVFEINANVIGGPNTNTSALSNSSNDVTKSNPYYISGSWYTNKYSTS